MVFCIFVFIIIIIIVVDIVFSDEQAEYTHSSLSLPELHL
jgi:hypothetical protein